LSLLYLKINSSLNYYSYDSENDIDEAKKYKYSSNSLRFKYKYNETRVLDYSSPLYGRITMLNGKK